MRFFAVLLCLLIVGWQSPVFAQSSASAPEDPWEVAGKPGAAHEKLKALVGNWDATIKSWSQPNTTPRETKARATKEWFLGSRFVKEDFEGLATQNAQKNINLETLRPFKILIPPLPEQRAIAAILSTWDEAITLTTRLIDALKRRKAALMQLLLTGEVRFSEFDGAWETLPLGKIANVKRGASPRPINDPQWFSETGRAWVRIADINASPTRFLNQASQYLSSLGEALSVKAEVGDLILSIAATIGVPKIVNIPACIHDGFVLITGYSDTTNGDFLYHYLSMLTSLLASGGQPGTQKNINSELVREIEIPTPDIPEQQKIADVLTIADEEILYWSSIAESLTKQKRGLMQQLLTGTVRVQVGER